MINTSTLLAFLLFMLPSLVWSQWNPKPYSNLKDVIKIESVSYDFDGNILPESNVSAYENGKLVHFQKFNKGNLVLEYFYEYELEDNLETILRTGTKIESYIRTGNSYDKQGRLKKSILFKGKTDETGYYQSRFKYDNEDRLTSYRVTNVYKGKKNHSTLNIVYPNDSTWKRITMDDVFDGVGFEIEYTYNEMNKLGFEKSISYEYVYLDEGSKHKNRLITSPFDTNPHGWIERDTIYSKGERVMVKKKILRSKLVYDDKGNWIAYYQINKEGKEYLMTRRKITYE